MQNLFSIAELKFRGRTPVCEIPLRDGRFAYMCIDGRLVDSAVAICDPTVFLDLWVESGTRPEIVANRHDWTRDYKYTHAEKGFSHGKENPVPLASVGFRWEFDHVRILTSRLGRRSTHRVAKPRLDFTNGITRTIWLMQNGAAFLPVECSEQEAYALNDAAGICAKVIGQHQLNKIWTAAKVSA